MPVSQRVRTPASPAALPKAPASMIHTGSASRRPQTTYAAVREPAEPDLSEEVTPRP
jgi:hypothetical protein